MASSSRRQKKHRRNKPRQPETEPRGPRDRIEHDRLRSKPSFSVEQLEPRILLSATWTEVDTGQAVDVAQATTEACPDTVLGHAADALGGLPSPSALAGDATLVGSAGGHGLFDDAASDVLGGGAGNDVLKGGAGDDRLSGGAGDDSLFGDAGDDVLSGGAGQDVLRGGAGNDRLDGGAGDDSLFGDAGDDVLTGGAGNDVLMGGAGHDRLDGGAGDDSLFGDAGDDVLSGGAGHDVLRGGAGNDRLDGGAGDDKLYGDAEDDVLTGAAGNDVLMGGVGHDRLDGGAGDDSLFGDAGSDVLSGGAGHDVLRGGADNDRLDGGAGDDKLYGDAGDDVLTGGAGNDVLTGGAGYDRLDGGAGDDSLFGDAGDDVLSGGAGHDVLRGGAGNDRFDGGAGDDKLYGDAGDDVLTGAAGSDVLMGGAGHDRLDGGAGDDNLFGDAGDDVLSGGAGHDVLRGGAGNDRLDGGAGDDTLLGDAGNDVLSGGAGHDVLRGGAGDDVLRGGAGDDVLQGGAGHDVADYRDATSGVTVDLTRAHAQDTGGAGTDTLSSIEGVVGSNHDDVFAFSNPAHQSEYTVDGGAGHNTIDLANYSFDKTRFSDDGGRVSVDMGDGQSFSIAYSGVNEIHFSDLKAHIVSAGSPAEAFHGSSAFINGGQVFSVTVKGNGTIDGSYDAGTDALTVGGGEGADATTALRIDHLTGDDPNVAHLTLNGQVGTLESNVDLGTVNLTETAHVERITVRDGAGVIEQLDVGADLDTATTINASVQNLSVESDLKVDLNINGNVGRLSIGDDVEPGATVAVAGNVEALNVGDEVAGNLNVGGDLGTLEAARLGGDVTVAGRAGSIRIESADPNAYSTGNVSVGGDLEAFSAQDFNGRLTAGAVEGEFHLVNGPAEHHLNLDTPTEIIYHGATNELIGPNQAPTADAGLDQVVEEGSQVTLDATGSRDPEGQALTYTWTQTGGPAVTLSDANAAQPTFTVPHGASDSGLTFRVEVSDGVNTSVDAVAVAVNADDHAPTDDTGIGQPDTGAGDGGASGGTGPAGPAVAPASPTADASAPSAEADPTPADSGDGDYESVAKPVAEAKPIADEAPSGIDQYEIPPTAPSDSADGSELPPVTAVAEPSAAADGDAAPVSPAHAGQAETSGHAGQDGTTWDGTERLEVLNPMDDLSDSVTVDGAHSGRGEHGESIDVFAAVAGAEYTSLADQDAEPFALDREVNLSDELTPLTPAKPFQLSHDAERDGFDGTYVTADEIVYADPASGATRAAAPSRTAGVAEAAEAPHSVAAEGHRAGTAFGRPADFHRRASLGAESSGDAAHGAPVAEQTSAAEHAPVAAAAGTGFFARLWGLLRGTAATSRPADNPPLDREGGKSKNRRS